MLYKVFIIVSMSKKSRINSSYFCYCYFWLVGKSNTPCMLTQEKVAHRKGHALSDQCGMWKSLSGVWLCNPMDYTVHGTLQARTLEWVAFPFSRGSSQPRDRTQVSLTAGGFFTNWAMRESLGFISYNTVLCVCGHPSEPFAMETYTNMVMMFCCAVSNKVSVSDPEPHVFCQHLWNCGRLACSLEAV